jgi:glycosyltransferase involved in cell wall biosynthesis
MTDFCPLVTYTSAMVRLQQRGNYGMTGYNVIGYVSADFGLGVAARNTLRLLIANHREAAVADLRLDDGRSGRDHSFDHLAVSGEGRLPHRVNILHVNPPAIGRLLGGTPWLDAGAGLNVAVPFWELTVLPQFWLADLGKVDVVLAPSRFIEKTIAAALPGNAPLVLHYPQTAFLPDRIVPDRRRFGLPPEETVFALSFEISSDTSRKNPWAAIEAFTTAFTNDDPVRLVVKINVSFKSATFEQERARLHEYASVNPRIVVYDSPLSYDEVLSLYASCDAYVSLHRSEGLGLGALEAMLLGKPVIATAWSGNMDFMDEHNSCLVPYRLVPVASPVYRGLIGALNAEWADPLIGEAAAWMRRLHDNAELRRSIGERARETSRARHVECLQAKPFTVVEEILSLRRTPAAGTDADAPQAAPAVFAAVAELLKENRPGEAVALYDRCRRTLQDTPLTRRFDELMRQIREKL